MTLLSILERLGMFEDVTADLYPYRFVITPVVIAAGLALAYLAYRRGVHTQLLRHRLATVLVGVPVLVISLVAGDYLLSPLWERSRIEEASPIAAVAGDTTDTSSPYSRVEQPQSGAAPGSTSSTATFQPKVVRSGDFMGADDFHFGRGDALLIQTGPESYVLRFENFSVRNGPDLYVYLSEHEDVDGVSEMLNLGRLKATDGAFNYEIPASVDVSKVKSAVVWCKQFAVLFTHADLM